MFHVVDSLSSLFLSVFAVRMYVFGGWVPVVESENKPNALGVEWICTNSLSLLNLGQY